MMTLVALITGATGQIGKAIAREIAKTGQYSVVLACRNEERAKKTVAELISDTKNHNISYRLVDTSLHNSIKSFAKSWEGPLHLLMNVASDTPRKRMETPEGIEVQFATNVLGYFWMMQEFSPVMAKSAPSKIVNVASYWAGDVDLDDLQFTRRSYDNDSCYRQSKACERMLSFYFAEKLKDSHVTVNVCHPGDVNSNLSRSLGFGGHETPEEGAATPVYVATNSKLEKVTGKYFEHLKEISCQFAKDQESIRKLVDYCEKF
ncbi:Retinol dehydrogenase 13 [Tritrichomonas foetus]|uniref:Retinol dehydrogenase 13 n=1 Tax=Tritrichomonas foetus TaxID=1144522 RepID=A0A1J4KUU8_9EUKA|nr:Retinol dehydrogenase 13 [Tritrichomonas foetus]|eukprot:OHT15063.1 Retinol dehydrogenase 13 [Tritrichomonas foetus]